MYSFTVPQIFEKRSIFSMPRNFVELYYASS